MHSVLSNRTIVMTKVVRPILLVLLCTLTVGMRDSRNESIQKRQPLYILAMVPFPDEEKQFQGANMLYMYKPLEEVLQNEAVGVNFSVDSEYQF